MLIRLYRRLANQHSFEECYYIECSQPLTDKHYSQLAWLIGNPGDDISVSPHFDQVVEIGPRISIETPFSSNAVRICRSLGIPVTRVEQSIRYRVNAQVPLVDPLTEQIYAEPLSSFATGILPRSVTNIPVLAEGLEALHRANRDLGLGMDADDLTYYLGLFARLGRDPTDVELFQIGNGNSEHSRHHFWTGIQVIDTIEQPESLMQIVKRPWKENPGNRITAFHDNSGVIEGAWTLRLAPETPGLPTPYVVHEMVQHLTATAETHNHPTLIAPFPGAETGAGGRIRDNRAVGRGGLVHAGAAGYAVGALHLPNFLIPGETVGGEQMATHASPLQILIEASNGVSDYGNKIGEPLVLGFTRSFGQMVQGARREFRKPVLYTAGTGRIDADHVTKRPPTLGMRIVAIGGPAYPIGEGGGSASSMIQGNNSALLDLKSVQRGDAETENRTNRVIQACAELGDRNPIESIHDQGAGGPSNVLTELMEPLGGRIDIRNIVTGDSTMSVLQLWVAEYQERYGLLVRPENLEVLRAICARESVNLEDLGEITGDGNVVLYDSSDGSTPVNLSLADILADVPRKRFPSSSDYDMLPVFEAPTDQPVAVLLRSVFRLPAVGSKGFLVRKVDRTVTGLVAQQQCCGPLQLPVADAAITADGYFRLTGMAQAIGENPNRMLAHSWHGARMAVTEMLTNLVSAGVTSLHDVSCRANWMWAAKLPGEGAEIYRAAVAMSTFMSELGIAIDGGKDSLSMATMVEGTQVVSPGQLVVFGYAPVKDITKHATPDFKGGGTIGFIDFGQGKDRLGGSALAQTFGEVGSNVPDTDDAFFLERAFGAMSELIKKDLVTAYHDRSDGGLITTVAEMCLSGNCGANVSLSPEVEHVARLFCEEAGMVFEFTREQEEAVRRVLVEHEVSWETIGITSTDVHSLSITRGGMDVLDVSLTELRQWFEATSNELEMLQSNPETVRAEMVSFTDRSVAPYRSTSVPSLTVLRSPPIRAAVIREEGSNGDREMAAALMAAGFEPWDISMQDIRSGAVSDLDDFQFVAFPGGFSYADVFGSAKGWAAPILFDPRIMELFDRFYTRENTASIGVCNGCQLMANIGWVPYVGLPEARQPKFLHNTSGRFESRWATVEVQDSPSILFKGMKGSVLGVPVAHGEGRLYFPDQAIAEDVRARNLAALRYVCPSGLPTERYPYNPNGSPEGITALTTPDGRHTAMMPHPERAFRWWQWHYLPSEYRKQFGDTTPWLQMFQNALRWCESH